MSGINLIELESLRADLIETTFNQGSDFKRISGFLNYFEIILSCADKNIEEAFLKEFLDDYLDSVSRLSLSGVEPSLAHKLISQLKQINSLSISSEIRSRFASEISRLEWEQREISCVLEGRMLEEIKSGKAYFPLLNRETPYGFYGLIDSVTVRITRTSGNDRFIIIPSEKEIEKKILDQCKDSWLLALSLSKTYIKKPYKYHEVIIHFDRKNGIYEGNSLGIALTLSFLEQILKYYNPEYIINIKEEIAFTGGVTETGEILPTGADVIKRKSELIFYSGIKVFVLSKKDETDAAAVFSGLLEKYPKRKIKLFPAEDITDILNRRDLVEIKKQGLARRTGKFMSKNRMSAAVAAIFTILFIYFFVLDLDRNPALIFYDSGRVWIQNSNNKNLMSFSYGLPIKEAVDMRVRIVDINKDDENEILLIETLENVENTDLKIQSLSCYSSKRELIWNFNFDEVVSSDREIMSEEYALTIADTLTENGRKLLLVYAINVTSFASAIFKLDLLNGRKVGDEYWCSGHISQVILADINNDGEKEIIGWGIDNGYEQPVLWAIDSDSLNGARPTTEEYQIHNKNFSDLLFYLRIPKTDYDYYVKSRTGTSSIVGLTYSDDIISFNQIGDIDSYHAALLYRYNIKTGDISIYVVTQFRELRDSLVAKGELHEPYTDTREFIEMQKNKILYWQTGKWVRKEEIIN